VPLPARDLPTPQLVFTRLVHVRTLTQVNDARHYAEIVGPSRGHNKVSPHRSLGSRIFSFGLKLVKPVSSPISKVFSRSLCCRSTLVVLASVPTSLSQPEVQHQNRRRVPCFHPGFFSKNLYPYDVGCLRGSFTIPRMKTKNLSSIALAPEDLSSIAFAAEDTNSQFPFRFDQPAPGAFPLRNLKFEASLKFRVSSFKFSQPYPSFLFAYFAYFAVLDPPYSQHPGFLRSPLSDPRPPFFVTARVTACNGFCNDLNLEKPQCLCGLLRCNDLRGGEAQSGWTLDFGNHYVRHGLSRFVPVCPALFSIMSSLSTTSSSFTPQRSLRPAQSKSVKVSQGQSDQKTWGGALNEKSKCFSLRPPSSKTRALTYASNQS
jgi:hypothetical protein